MSGVAYGFRDDLTEAEIDRLIADGTIFECSDHGVLEVSGEFTAEAFDEEVARIREQGGTQE